MKAEVYKCDGNGCTAVRGESNHWFIGWDNGAELTLKPWDAKMAELTVVAHLCGSACILKFVSQWLSRSSA